MSNPLPRPPLVLVTLALGASPSLSHAETIIRSPGAHTDYAVELEPRLLLHPTEPPGFATGRGLGIGPGFHVGINLVDNGPITSLNNSLALGLGLDWITFPRGGRCSSFDCESTSVTHFFIPLVLQWNFWLTHRWSVFGEPGLAYRFSPDMEDRLDTFILTGGARLHFTDRLTLTLRAGYPAFGVGVSFLL